MIIKKINLVVLLASLLFLFSCTGEHQEDQAAAKILSPVESVRSLMSENRQYENNPAKSSEFHSPAIKSILDRGYIIFGMHSQDQKPFFYRDEQTGEFIGLDVEIAYSIANRLGVKAVFNRDASSFDGVIQLVTTGQADVALSKLSLTMRRAELVLFTKPYITFRQALLINRLEYAKIGSEAQLANYIRNFSGTLGVIANSSYQNYAQSNFPRATVRPFDDWNKSIDALFAGQVLAIYRDEGEILIVNNTREDASILLKPVFINDKRDPIAMAVSADAPLLQDWLNIFLDEYITENRANLTPIRLIERHFRNNS